MPNATGPGPFDLPRNGLAAMARRAGQAILVGAVAVTALAGLLHIAGFSVAPSLAALWRGAFGSLDAILSATLVRATPLLLIRMRHGHRAPGRRHQPGR